jgi:hypothetical protein
VSPVVRIARALHATAAGAVVVLVFVQVYLIAAYIFGRAGALSAHKTVGGTVIFVEILVALTGLIGWWRNWPQVSLGIALLIVGVLQVSFAENLGSSPTVHALHGMLALAVLLLAWQTALRGSRTFRGSTTS